MQSFFKRFDRGLIIRLDSLSSFEKTMLNDELQKIQEPQPLYKAGHQTFCNQIRINGKIVTKNTFNLRSSLFIMIHFSQKKALQGEDLSTSSAYITMGVWPFLIKYF
jgi:hypothetical protein